MKLFFICEFSDVNHTHTYNEYSLPRCVQGTHEDLEKSPETPYSRAQRGEAPYFVWPLSLHVIFNLIVIAASTSWWQIPIIGALFVVFEDHFKDLRSR
jgi:hypothetical protein